MEFLFAMEMKISSSDLTKHFEIFIVVQALYIMSQLTSIEMLLV